LAILERLPGKGVVRRHRGDDGHRVDLRRGDHLAGIGDRPRRWILDERTRTSLRVAVTNGGDPAIRMHGKVPDDVRAPVSVADDADSEHDEGLLGLWPSGQ